MLHGESYALAGRQYGLGRVTPGNWPKVFTALPQDYSANATKVAFRPGAGPLHLPEHGVARPAPRLASAVLFGVYV